MRRLDDVVQPFDFGAQGVLSGPDIPLFRTALERALWTSAIPILV